MATTTTTTRRCGQQLTLSREFPCIIAALAKAAKQRPSSRPHIRLKPVWSLVLGAIPADVDRDITVSLPRQL